MEDAPKTGVILSIEQDQRIDLTVDGRAVRGNETYIREYVGVIESGLMARMSNAAYKILHALALRARILGDPRRPRADEEFKELQQLGIVTARDKGLLFCFTSREQLMEDTGIGSVHTVDAAMLELSEIRIVKRVSSGQPRLGRGWFGPNVYLIHPESFIAKFSGEGAREAVSASRNGEQKLLPARGTESSLRNTVNRTLKINNNQQQEENEIISKHFAASVGQESYAPSEKEIRKIAVLLAEGYTVEQICAGITRAVRRAQATGRQVHSLAYCIPEVRSATVELERKTEAGTPKPTPGTTLVPNAGQPRTEFSTAVLTRAEDRGICDLDQLAGEDAELRELLEIVQERNPRRGLQKSDVRAWQVLALRFRDLAAARGTTPIGLVTQAVLKGIEANSDHAGYFAPRLAETILDEWQRRDAKGRLETDRESQAVDRRPRDPSRDSDQRPAGRHEPTIVRASFQTPGGAMEASQVWETALRELKGQMTKATFDTWVRPTFVAKAQDGDQPMLIVGTHNPYAVEWLEQRLHAIVQRTVVGIVGKNVTVEYRCVNASQER